MKKQFKLAAGLAALAISFGAQAGVIDLFSTDQGTYTDTTRDSADTGTIIGSGIGGTVGSGDSTILGGNRDLYVSKLNDNSPSNLVGRRAEATVAGGVFDFSTSSLTTGRAQIQWDGSSALDLATPNNIDFTGLDDGIGLPGYDLTLGGTVNSFLVDILFSDNGFKFAVSAYTNSTDWTQVTIAANEHLVPGSSTIDFGAFGLATGDYLAGTVHVDQFGAGVDLTRLGALVVDIDQLGQRTSLDLTLDNVTTVPEPGVLGLMGIGLLGFAFSGRAGRKTVA